MHSVLLTDKKYFSYLKLWFDSYIIIYILLLAQRLKRCNLNCFKWTIEQWNLKHLPNQTDLSFPLLRLAITIVDDATVWVVYLYWRTLMGGGGSEWRGKGGLVGLTEPSRHQVHCPYVFRIAIERLYVMCWVADLWVLYSHEHCQSGTFLTWFITNPYSFIFTY